MITGGVKFFLQSYALFKNGVSASASSNTAAAKSIIDVNKYTQWESLDSSDTVTEEIIINLKTSRKVDRIFLLGMNFKTFEVLYLSGGSYVPFTGVVGINGIAKAALSETDYALSDAYYEFNEVTTSAIKILVTKTQTINAQKFLKTFIVTKEIGTLKGFPRVGVDCDRNEASTETLSGKFILQKGFETTEVDISFKSHPYQEDLDILDTLFNSDEPFLVYPCGGRSGEPYFRINQKGWRAGDVFNMQTKGKMANDYEKGVYTLGFNKTIKFVEHI